MARKKKYDKPRTTISPIIDCELLEAFDDYTRVFGCKNRNDEIQKAMINHMSDEGIKEEDMDILETYKIDLADRYCNLHGIAVIGSEVISTRKNRVIPEEWVSLHLMTFKLLKGEISS